MLSERVKRIFYYYYLLFYLYIEALLIVRNDIDKLLCSDAPINDNDTATLASSTELNYYQIMPLNIAEILIAPIEMQTLSCDRHFASAVKSSLMSRGICQYNYLMKLTTDEQSASIKTIDKLYDAPQ
jgi:hypothetical protein